MPLTDDEIRFFRHNGFLRLPTRLPDDRVAELKDAILHNMDAGVEPVNRDDKGKVVRISQVWGREPIFRETITCDEALDPVSSLIGPNIQFIRNRHNHATLNFTAKTYLHRDILQWSRTILTVVFFLEDSTVENGCTLVLPGSHLLPQQPSTALEEEPWLNASRLREQLVPLPVPAGGMLAIDSTIIHTGGVNTTGRSRMSMTAGYHAVDELVDADNPKRILVRGEHLYDGNDAGVEY